MKFILGSGSEDKLAVLEKALKDLRLESEVVGVEVDSGIDKQPLDKEVTLVGAKNRARNAKVIEPMADFWVGIEGGLHDDGSGYKLVTRVCLIDKNGNEYLGEGVELELPKEVSNKVKKGGWFGGVIREYADNHDIDENLVTRKIPFEQAIFFAYGNYLKENFNLESRKKAVVVILNEKNQVLLVQLNSYSENDWNIPGGGVEEGEELETAIRREIFEELGIDKIEIIEKSDVVSEYEWPGYITARRLAQDGKVYKGQRQVYFVGRFLGDENEIKLQADEIRRCKWVDRKDLKQYLNFPNQWEYIEEVIKNY